MNKAIDIGLSFGGSVVVGLVALWTLEALQLKYALSLTLSLMVFASMNLYTKYNKSFSLPLTRANIGMKLWWLSWFFAILVVIIIKPLEIFSQFLAWNEISALIWLRLIASFSLTTIYPGYASIKLILRGKNLQFLEKTVFSILLSIFISSSIAFAGIRIEGSIGTLSLLILLFVNIFLLILTSYSTRHDLFSKANAHHVLSIKLTDIMRTLLLFALIAFVLFSVYSVNFPDKFVPTIDQWSHYGDVLRALSGTLFSFVPNYYWLYLYEALFIFATGLPSINAYMTLFVLCILPIPSFYLMCSGFWNKTKSLVATTVYALFSGLGGIYATYLRLTDEKEIAWITSYAADKTYDMSAGAVSFSFYLLPKLIGFSTLFILIYLIYDSKLSRSSRGILTSALFALGYLTHVAEIFVFSIVAVFLLLFSKKDVSNVKSLPYGFVMGLIIVAIVDLLASQKKYGLYYLLMGHFDLFALGLLSIVGFLCILSSSRLNLTFIGEFIAKVARRLSLPIVIVSIYVLTLGVIIWIFLRTTFSIGATGGTFVWYLYPVRLGVVLFIAVLGAYQLFRIREFKILKLSLIILLISVGLERLLSYFIVEDMLQFSIFPPVRMVEFTWIGVALLAAPILISILQCSTNTNHTNRKFSWISKKIAATVVLVMVIIVGSSSTLYNVQIRSTPSMTLTDDELKALDFLRNETPGNVTVLALGYSVNKINAFGGRFPMMYYQPAVFGANDFETFADILKLNTFELYGHLPVRYFWLSNSDVIELKKYEKGYFVGHLLNYLPVVYANNEVKIFEIPAFSPPSSESDLTIIKSTSNTSKQNVFMSAIALAGLNYSIRYDFDLKPPSSTLFLTNDPNVNLKYSAISKAKKVVVFNTDASRGQFANILKIAANTEKKQIIDGISGSSMNLSIPTIEIPTFYSLDNNVEPLAFYTKNKQSFSPYAFRKAAGNQEIIYVEIYPYLETLQRNTGTDLSVEMFTKLGDLINVLNLELPKYEPPSTPMGRAILFGQTMFEGAVVFDPTSFYIPALDSKWTQTIGWKEDMVYAGWSTITSKPENGSIDVSTDGEILTATFNASAKNVWQYLFLDAPKVNASQFRFLFLKEKIEALSYSLGYLRIVAGGYTYNVRGWTSETSPPGHPWKTYVFDLSNALSEKSEALTTPEGPITQISWTGYSTGENGGTAKLYLDYVMLTSSPITPTDYGEITASLDLSETSSVFVDGLSTAKKTFANIKILDMEISGDFNSTFTGAEARLIPPGLGRYSKIAFNKGCNLTLWLTNDSQIGFATLIEGKPTNITINGGKLHVILNSTKEEMVAYMSDAQVSANGYTEFEKAFISWPYSICNSKLPMEVTGPITFKVNMMDQDFSLISELEVEGTYKVLTQQQVKWNEWNIPWLEVLTSPYHILLISAIAATVTIREVKRRHRFKNKLQSGVF